MIKPPTVSPIRTSTKTNYRCQEREKRIRWQRRKKILTCRKGRKKTCNQCLECELCSWWQAREKNFNCWQVWKTYQEIAKSRIYWLCIWLAKASNLLPDWLEYSRSLPIMREAKNPLYLPAMFKLVRRAFSLKFGGKALETRLRHVVTHV